MDRMMFTCTLALLFAALASAASPVCDRNENDELGRKANGRQIWCYTMNGDQESCEKSFVVRNGKRHACVFNPNMATFSNLRRRNPTGPGRCILEKRMAKFECGLLSDKRIVTRGHYTPPGPGADETPAQCLERKAQESLNLNFKIDCEAEADANEEEIPELEEVPEGPSIGDPVAHHPGEIENVEPRGQGEYVKPTTGSDAWDAGFVSEQSFDAEDDVQGITFKPHQAASNFWVGLQGHAERAIEGHHADFVFAFSAGDAAGGWLEIWEDGQHVHTVTQWVDGVGNVGRWNADSLMEIAVNTDGEVEYKMDDVVVYTSTAPVEYPMVATALFQTRGSGVTGLTFAARADRRRLDEEDEGEESDYDDEEDFEDEEYDEDEESDYDDEEGFEDEQDGSTRRLRGGKQ